HHRMDMADGLHALEIAIRARLVVRPADAGRMRVVEAAAILAFRVDAVEVLRLADATEVAYGTAEVHVVARDQQSAAEFAKAADARAIGGRQAIAGVGREQPQLVESRIRKLRKDGVGLSATIPIARRHPERELPVVIAQLRQEFAQAAEARDVPVIRITLDRG